MGNGAAAVKDPQTFSGVTTGQDPAELAHLIALLRHEGVKSYGEIGAREGDTFHAVMSALPVGSKGVALDLPEAKWGHNKTRRKLEAAVKDLVSKGYRASAIFGDSSTISTIRMFHGRGPYDAILIDGDHRLEGVTADWNRYGKMARIVAFHDINGDGQQWKDGSRVEVPLLWRAIQQQEYATAEFITPGSIMGIGVVWVQ